MDIRPVIIALFLAITTISGWAQQVQIKGVIIDKETKEPLPFSSVGLKTEQIGALSNEHGLFIVPAPTQNATDSLIVVALGYARRAVLVRRGVAVPNLTIEVPKRAVELSNVCLDLVLAPLVLRRFRNSNLPQVRGDLAFERRLIGARDRHQFHVHVVGEMPIQMKHAALAAAAGRIDREGERHARWEAPSNRSRRSAPSGGERSG